jgi:sec-independent protein translocase protein TatA
MFGLGGPEIILIVAVFVVLFGAKSIPQIARGLGKGIREFKDATNGIKSQIQDEVKDIEVPKIEVPKIDLD